MVITTKKTERGNDLSTKEYRQLGHISYSDIKLFLTDPKLFYRKKILREEIAEKGSLSKTIGDLVHCKLLEPQNYDKLFCTAPVSVTGQMGTLAENLYIRTIRNMDPDTKKLTVGFPVIMEQAINDSRYNGKGEEVAFKGKTFDKIVDMFNGSDAEILYKTMRINHGKTVINPYNDEQAQHICNEALENPWVNRWLIDQPGEEAHNELPVTYEHEGVQCKNLIDRNVVNHDEKWIQPVDVKSSWENDNFQKNYLYLMYYIQAAHYDQGCRAWAIQQGIGDYEVRPMKFICVDSQGYMKSLLYNLTAEDLEMAYNGFRIHGREYIGLYSALMDIKYGIETGQWKASREAEQNMGICKLGINYE